MLKKPTRATGVLIALSAIAVAPQLARAGSGGIITSPPAGAKATSGLQMVVDATWVDGFGYRPVRVDIATLPPAPTTAERSLLVEVTPIGWGREPIPTVSQFVDLPQGSKSVSVSLAVPQRQPWSGLTVVVYEDGYLLEDLSVSSGFPGYNPGLWNDGLPALLFIDRDAPLSAQRSWRIGPAAGTFRGPVQPNTNTHGLPDIRRLVNDLSYFGADTSVPTDDASLINLVRQIPQIEILPPQDLPQRWIELSAVDVAFISLPDLQFMQTNHAPQWNALHAWLASGPTLCVYGVGEQFEQLEELERLLELPPRGAAAGGAAQFNNWNSPSSAMYGSDLQGFGQGARQRQFMYGPGGVVVMQPDPAVEPAQPAPRRTAPRIPPFVWRDAGLGRVVALAADDPFPGDDLQWQWLFNTLEANRTIWPTRHGLSLTQDNADYWNFLIPGVGLAPVTPFRVLITLFVVLIGPVNYFALRRWKRLYLLLLTVPVGAAVVTLGLFAYALLSDGLGVRARVRSFTQLDQAGGRAVSWSRQTYHAGLAPSRGLTFPSDAAVYPIEQFASSSFETQRRPQRLDWRDYEQRLTRGYLSSRVMGQFMVVRSQQRTQAELRVLAPAPPNTSPRVENLLGSKIHQLFLIDDSGQPYWAEDVPDGATWELQPTTTPAAHAKLRPIFAAHAPQYPQGFDPNNISIGPRYYISMSRWQNGQMTTQASSVLERKMQACLLPVGGQPAPRSYVAIVAASPGAPLGYAKASQQASFHVVAGTW